jgi:hypothetical protein
LFDRVKEDGVMSSLRVLGLVVAAGVLMGGCANSPAKTVASSSTSTPTSTPTSTDCPNMNTYNSASQSCELVPEATGGTSSESSAPSQTTPAPEASDIVDMALGTTITVTGTHGANETPFAMTVTASGKKSSRAAIEAYGEKPRHTYVGLLVQYVCTEGVCDYNSFDFTVRNNDGEEFPSANYSFKPDLQSGNIRKGRKAKGYITFDLPKGTYSLEYRGNAFDENPANWLFKV